MLKSFADCIELHMPVVCYNSGPLALYAKPCVLIPSIRKRNLVITMWFFWGKQLKSFR